MFKIGDNIDYGFYKNIFIIGEDDKHYILQYSSGIEKPVYKWLVEKYGKRREEKT